MTTTSCFKHEWPYLVSLALIAFLIFLPGVNYSFLTEWDDGGFVSLNHHLLPCWDNCKYWLNHATQGIFTPVTMYSLMLDRWLFGLNPLGYHLHNLLLHSAATLLLYGIVRHLGVRSWLAFLVAVLWAVHPQRVESVVWITERKDVLSGVFAFGAMLLFMYTFDRNRHSWIVIVLLLLAFGAKPSTLTLPAIMAIYAICKRRQWDIVKYLWPMAAAAAVFYICFYQISHTAITGCRETFPRLWLVPLHNGMWYLVTAVMPFELNPIYPRIGMDFHTWAVVCIGGIAVSAGIAAAVFYRVSRADMLFKVLPWVGAWLCCFLPVSGFLLRFTNTDYCDRYNYLLSAVVWVAIGMLAEKFAGSVAANGLKQKTLGVIMSVLAAVYLFLTISYIPFWQNTGTLFSRALETPCPNTKAIEGLGLTGMRNGDAGMMELASNLFIWKSSESRNIPLPENMKNPVADYYTGMFFYGMALVTEKKYKAAQEVFKIAETAYQKKDLQMYEIETYLPWLWSGLANCCLASGRQDDARKYLKLQLMALQPDAADACFCRGLIAFLKKDMREAVREWQQADALQPGDAKIQHNLKEAETRLLRERKSAEQNETKSQPDGRESK